nr:hypothetical protein [Tanacetum cinerariifolium]
MIMIVPVEEVYVEALQVKYSIIDWERFDRDGLVRLWDLVKERFSTTEPTYDKEKALWVELKRLFEPDNDDIIWKLQRYMHDPLAITQKITIKRKKPGTTLIPPPNDDKERDEIAKSILLSLNLHNNTLAAEAQENIAKVQENLEEDEIEKMVEGDEDKESYASECADSVLNDDVDDSDTSMEIRKEQKQTLIPSLTRSPRIILSSDKNITRELTETVPLPATTISNTSHSKRINSTKYNHFLDALHRMCRRQGYMIQNMEQKCVTTKQFWKTHNQVNQVLYLGVA